MSSGIIAVADLPHGHLFKLLYRRFGDHTPMDWDAIQHRLKTHTHEARQWVKTDYIPSRLFLHELCDYEFGKDDNDDDDNDNNNNNEGYENSEDVGSSSSDDDDSDEGFRRQNSEIELRILQSAIDAFPRALRHRDGMGYLPLHRICCRCKNWSEQGASRLSWYSATPKAILMILKSYPEAASKLAHMDGKSALHCLLQAEAATAGQGRLDCLKELLDLYPRAAKIADGDGVYPLHVACHSGDPSIINALINKCPQAAEIRCKSPYLGHRTPLQTFLQYNEEQYEQARIILDRCPWAAGIGDSQLLATYGGIIQPAGDSLDYVCVNYCNKIGVKFSHNNVIQEVVDQSIELYKYRRGYIMANMNYVEEQKHATKKNIDNDDDVVDCESFSFLLDIYRVMYGPRPFLPLHACVEGRLCRPWHLAAVQAIATRYPEHALKRDSRGNLPLHSFLESYMIERERAMDKFFAYDEEEYHFAVNQCLRLLLDIDETTVTMTNAEGRLPLHLAIEHGSGCTFDTVISHLLSVAPSTVLVRDPKTGLYPFMSAAVGISCNLDSIYGLLQFDPNVLTLL